MSRWEREPDLDRFERLTEPMPTGCLVWQGKRDKQGYGRMYAYGTNSYLAHRFAYEQFIGPIPEGMQVDHLCRNQSCVNPEHLEAVTPLVNTHRSILARGLTIPVSHCVRGHAFDEANTRYNKRGDRACRACDRENQKRYAERRTA